MNKLEISSRYRYQIDPDSASTASKVLKLVGRCKHVLELGTAAGAMTQMLKENCLCSVVGIEIDPISAENARPYCDKLIVGNLDEMNLLVDLGNDRFDVIVAADVLEHLRDPWRCLEMVRQLLKPEGYLVLSVPNVAFNGLLGSIISGTFPYGPVGLLDQTHLRFFTLFELESMLVSTGFIPETLDRQLLGVENSEFASQWDEVPVATKQALASNPEGLTYQFVMSAKPTSRERLTDYLRLSRKREVILLHEQQTARQQASEHEKELSVREKELSGLTAELSLREKALSGLTAELSLREKELSELAIELSQLRMHLAQTESALHQVLTSTTWRMASPLRWLRKKIHQVGLVWRFIGFLMRNPSKVLPSMERLVKDWRSGDRLAFKRTVKDIPLESGHDDDWLACRKDNSSMMEMQVKEKVACMAQKPLISILLPTYETGGKILRETLDSVVAQLYPEWELCVADDGSMQPHVRKILENYARRDKRIHLCFHDVNTGIAAATNRALKMAGGEYVVLLDHDDRLEKHALFRIAESALADKPDMIYSDELLLSPDGTEVIQFVFRPAFSLELLRSHPYIVHMVAFRTALVREIGGLDESLSVSQDYDLILRVAEKSRTIVHIPEVLYLWRQQPDSAGHGKQSQVMETSSKILAAHLARCGETATVAQGKWFNFFETRYPLQAGLRVAILIPTKNHGELVRQCVESLERTIHHVKYDIIVIDHESTDPASLAYFAELSNRHTLLHYKGPFNFSAINNWAVNQHSGDYSHYLFCNNDIEALEDGWLERMMELGQKPDVGIVGSALFYPDRLTYQHAGVCVGMYGVAEHFAKFMEKFLPDGRIQPGYLGSLITNHELSAVTAACLLMRKDAFDAINGYDEAFAVGFGDVDLCLRTRNAGYRVLYCPHAELIHHESITRGKSSGRDPHPLDSALFLRRWGGFIETGDPYANSNLSLHDTRWATKKPFEFNVEINRRIFHGRVQHKEMTE